jgi:hypothetical protein
LTCRETFSAHERSAFPNRDYDPSCCVRGADGIARAFVEVLNITPGLIPNAI